jgi:hypothetical protein
VWIRLTSAQDAHLNNDILPDTSTETDVDELGSIIELFIKEALWDAGSKVGEAVNPDTKPADGDFKNLIAEKADARILVTGDVTKPALVAADEKPVRFDSETRNLTLKFREAIDATPRSDVKWDRIHIMNSIFEFDEDSEKYEPQIDESSQMTLSGATVTEGYATTVTIALLPDQRDVLKGDNPKLYIDAGL